MLIKSKKKGFIRILEAALAAILLLGFISLVTLPNYVRQTTLEDEVFKSINTVLDDIERENALRTFVLNNNLAEIDTFINEELGKKQINALSSICNLGSSCAIPDGIPTDKDIFVRERVITDGALIVKKIAIHAWTKF